jgi:hypothetical protein
VEFDGNDVKPPAEPDGGNADDEESLLEVAEARRRLRSISRTIRNSSIVTEDEEDLTGNVPCLLLDATA